jgi:hypothetical protein
MKFLILSFFIFSYFIILSQENQLFRTGINLKFIFSLGSHEKSIGIRLNSYLQFHFIQLNGSSSIQFYNYSWGNRRNFFENRTAFGIVGFFGQKNQYIDWNYSTLTKQSPHDYAVSYSSIWYHDNVGTSQRSGAFGIQIKRLSLWHENDAFAGIATDRFRSGVVNIFWNDSLYKIGSGIVIWTGETTGVPKLFNPKVYPKSYKILSLLPYGKTSHGVFFSQVLFKVGGNSVGLQMGLDSEEIRHQIQNKLFHDLPFLPTKFQNQTPHYPRLNSNGLPVFTKENVRKNRFYYSVRLNSI